MRNTSHSISFLSPTMIQLRLDLGRTVQSVATQTIPDGVVPDPDSGWVFQDGAWIGRVTPGGMWMATDVYKASPLDALFDLARINGERVARVDDATRWSVEIDGAEVEIASISRKAHIRDSAETGWFTFDFETTQNVFIELDAPLERGQAFTIDFDHPRWQPLIATYAPAKTVSEAIHTNLIGHDPDDSAKIAYLSSWNGRLLDGAGEADATLVAQEFTRPLRFQVIDDSDGSVVLVGKTERATPADTPTKSWQNFAGTDVWQIDFSDLTTEGSYHVRVAGVGRSHSFEISDSHWGDVFETAFTGFLNQRSGIELTADVTDFAHPRSLHPEDGKIKVLASSVRLMDTNEGYDYSLPDQFDLLAAGETGRVLKGAWGGWHDAGDWDRRTQHLEAARKLIELHELAPEWSESLQARIPEAGNARPDLLDEAIWGMSLFARLQTAAGGVRGGIEGENYSGFGSASWTEEATLYAYAPDIWTSWEFAASAAKLSVALADYRPGQAATWLERAERAMDWAEDRLPETLDFTLATSRNLAAVELYRATGDAEYHDIFLQTSSYRLPDDNIDWQARQYEAAFVYARMDDSQTRDAVAGRAGDALVAQADFLLDRGSDTPFGYAVDPYAPYGWGNTAQQPWAAADHFARAHHLTGDQRYLRAMAEDMQYTLGANPLNSVFVTGFDDVRTPEGILNADADSMGGTPPSGITLYGDYNIFDYGTDFFHDVMYDDVWPNFWQTPVNESFNAFSVFVPSSEYTVQQGITDTTFTTGYLDAHSGQAGESFDVMSL